MLLMEARFQRFNRMGIRLYWVCKIMSNLVHKRPIPLPVSSLLTSSHKCEQLRHEKQKAKQRWQNLLHEDTNVQLYSDYFSPMIPLFQMWPGYGGLVYEGLNDGHIMALKVLPASTAPSPNWEF
jgi:hypothetical protein